MSTISVINAKHPSSASNNIVLDSSGNATFAGTAAMASSFLRNRIINGDMRIDQRNAGAAVTSGGLFPVDRFQTTTDFDGTFSAQRSTVVPAGFTNSLLFTVTSPDSSLGASQYAALRQIIEGFNVADFGWGAAGAQTVTLSFWVRSSVTGTYGGSLRNGASNRSYPFTYTVSVANTWEYKTLVIPGDTSGAWATDNTAGLTVFWGLGVGSSLSGTAGAWGAGSFLSATGATSVVGTNGATFYLTGVQLEVGSAATPFERRLFGQELALCQRYYAKSYNTNLAVPSISNDGTILAVAVTTSVGGLGATIQFPVEMRAPPTMTFYSPTSLTPGLWRDGGSGTDKSVSVYVAASTRAVQVLNTAIWSGAGAAGFGHYAAAAEL